MTELMRSSMVTGIELHATFLVMVVLLYLNMRHSYDRNTRKEERSLSLVYAGCMLMLISDCAWTTVSTLCKPDNTVAYIINLVYFIGSSFAAACWFVFCINQLGRSYAENRPLHIIPMVIYDAMLILYLLSPWFGFIFSIQDGEYVRGSLFFLDPAIKMGYIGAASVISAIRGVKKKISYLRKKDMNLALFGIPVLIGGILQTVTGVDFNCLGITAALVLVYVTGITNLDSENTDAIYSLGDSFAAAYIVNMDTGELRMLHRDNVYAKELSEISAMDYSTRISDFLSEHLVPEDRKETMETFALANVAKRFEIDSAFSIRYRVRENSGKTVLHAASFIRAAGKDGKQEFLLGINAILSDSLLYERNESLRHGDKKLDQINASIIDSVAKIVESRDSGSGEHIVRLKRLTELLARGVMSEYPEYNLDEETVKLISSASVLHDVGKIVIPDGILLKEGWLSEDEFRVMKTHCVKGCDILNMFPLGLDDAFFGYAMSICRWHHEKYDGKGYPDGLAGEDIPIAAQIVSAADCFDALVSERPYKDAYSTEKAIEMIVNGECGAFSPKIIHVLQKQKGKMAELARLYK